MKIDVYETAWYVLETLHKHGSLNANQIQTRTKKINRITMYKAFPLLKKEGLIQRDNNKMYSLNLTKFEEQKKYLTLYDEYQNTTENFKKIFLELSEKFKNHTPILNPGSDSDRKLAKELVKNSSFDDMISSIVRLFELGSMMDFFINADVFSKTIEKKAISLRKRNEKFVSKFMNIIKNAEPVLWGETIMLIQTRLATKISPA